MTLSLSNYFLLFPLRNVDMNEIRKMYPKAKVEMIAGAGHFVHSDKPQEFLEIVKNFLR